jgi:hypothetical protein
MLRFMIRIGLDFIDQSNHAAVNGVLNETFKFAINKRSASIALKTMSHLRSNKYNKEKERNKYLQLLLQELLHSRVFLSGSHPERSVPMHSSQNKKK